MASLRHSVSRRDIILLLVGAVCMHLSGLVASSIEVNEQPPLLAKIPQEVRTTTTTITTTASIPKSTATSIHRASQLPETTVVTHAPGWTVFKNLYMSNGTLFIVSNSLASSFPEIRMMTSTGLKAENTPENIELREPTAENMDFLTLSEARRRWGGDLSAGERNRVWQVNGNTWLFNDPDQFLNHYYHFIAELIFGAWAFWTGAFSETNKSIHAQRPGHVVLSTIRSSTTPDVDRIIFPHASSAGWRDGPGFNGYALRAAFPSTTVEVQEDWLDRVYSTSGQATFNSTYTPEERQAAMKASRAWVFPVALLADRSAAFRGQICGSLTQRTASEAFEVVDKAGKLARGWWNPVRRSLWSFAGVEARELKVPETKMAEPFVRASADQKGLPMPEHVVITYISRQSARRRLIQTEHDVLVQSLDELIKRRKWTLNIVEAEKLTKDEQVRVVAGSTILLGVHGNGLTHLVFMAPTRVSTVIEMFYPGGFAHDYEWTTRAMGMKHFGVWNDTSFTHPKTPDVAYPEGFQGTSIPIHGPTVARLIEDRVDGLI